jgi:putative nucleotide binding protein
MEGAKEEFAIVLDFLPNGYPFDKRPSHKKTPIAQAMGREHFTLLELVPKRDIFLQPYEEVYIGEEKREKIHHIQGSLPFDRLTVSARNELDFVVKEVVHKNQERFVKFYNEAGPLSTRMHQLELIPGIGKKHMWELLEARKEKPFESFEDIKKRVKLMPDPESGIVKRILLELEGVEKRKIFVR